MIHCKMTKEEAAGGFSGVKWGKLWVEYCIKSGAQSGRNSGTDNRRLFLARNRRLLCRNRRLLYIQKMQMMPAGGFELWTIRWRKYFAFWPNQLGWTSNVVIYCTQIICLMPSSSYKYPSPLPTRTSLARCRT